MSAYRLLCQVLRGRRRAAWHVAGWSAVEGLPSLASGLLIARALREGFLVGRPLTGLVWLSGLLTAALISSVATSRLYPWLAEVVEPAREQLVLDALGGVLQRAVEGSVGPLTAGVGVPGPGLAQAVHQTDIARQLMAALLRGARQLVVPVLAAAVGLALLSPRLAVVSLAPVLLALTANALLMKGAARRHRMALVADEALSADAASVLSGLRDVTATGAADWAGNLLIARTRASYAAARASAVYDLTRQAVVGVAVLGPLAALLVAAAVWVPTGRVGVAALVGAVTYVQQSLVTAVRSLVHTGSGWMVELAVVLQRLSGAHADVGPVGADPAPAGQFRSQRGTGRVDPGDRPGPQAARLSVRGLRFAYGNDELPVLDGLNLKVTPGEHLAVVGPSGSGKSTLALLIAGLLPPDAGSVLVDGTPAYTDGRPRRDVVLLPQEAYVAAGSVRENLAYLAGAPADALLQTAIEAFGLTPLLDRLGSLDTVLPPGGAGLSDGERQLMCLARAWVAQPPAVLLDEATSNLTPAQEALALTAFRRSGVTLVVITHRLTAVDWADRVLVMDGTDVVVGVREDVRDASPLFAELMALAQG